jgi:Family of unknown function (DUF6011)
MKQITSKYEGRCKACNNQFPAGTTILWSAGFGAKHRTCPPVVLLVRTGSGIDSGIKVATKPEGPKVDLASVAAFINGAQERGLKFPKVRFVSSTNEEIRLSVAGEKSKAPGSVQVKLAGEWIGRVELDGSITGRTLRDNAALLADLVAIAKDPAVAAKRYAQLFGNCSFCSKQLTDAGSIEVGYGPICAAHWGLPHTPKGTPVLTLGTPQGAWDHAAGYPN